MRVPKAASNRLKRSPWEKAKTSRLKRLNRQHEALMASHDGWLFCRCETATAIRALTQEIMADVRLALEADAFSIGAPSSDSGDFTPNPSPRTAQESVASSS